MLSCKLSAADDDILTLVYERISSIDVSFSKWTDTLIAYQVPRKFQGNPSLTFLDIHSLLWLLDKLQVTRAILREANFDQL